MEIGNVAGKFVVDFISGKRVRATPEEAQAVQVFARRLVEDYDSRSGFWGIFAP